MRQKSNKRGAAEEWLEQIPEILLTVFVLIGIFILVNILINQRLDVTTLQQEVFVHRIIYAPDSISYYDNFTNRTYPGVIDMKKFNDEVLDQSMIYSYQKQFAARFELFDFQKNLVKTAYYNRQWYRNLEPLARALISGFSGATLNERTYPVVFRENGVDSPGLLKISLIMPN